MHLRVVCSKDMAEQFYIYSKKKTLTGVLSQVLEHKGVYIDGMPSRV